jgi:hypothetical protein
MRPPLLSHLSTSILKVRLRSCAQEIRFRLHDFCFFFPKNLPLVELNRVHRHFVRHQSVESVCLVNTSGAVSGLQELYNSVWCGISEQELKQRVVLKIH